MNISLHKDAQSLGKAAGQHASGLIAAAIKKNGYANVILATGNSQLATLSELVNAKDIDWRKVTMFHLDEYVGISDSHKASFRKYLTENFVMKVPVGKYYLINGEGDPRLECARLNEIIVKHPIDVALIGIGENGHLAFNDPPADFDTEDPYIVVTLDLACRKQQVGEGWFKTIDDVPSQAISMSVRHILKSSKIICSVPDERKADAVKNALEEKVNNLFPATILQTHADCFLYLDTLSASKVSTKTLGQP